MSISDESKDIPESIRNNRTLLSTVVLILALLGFFAILLVLAGLLSPSPVEENTTGLTADTSKSEAITSAERDEFLRIELGKRLEVERSSIVGEFKHDVKDRIAHLYGAVDSDAYRLQLEAAAREVEGIRGVVNNIDLKDINN